MTTLTLDIGCGLFAHVARFRDGMICVAVECKESPVCYGHALTRDCGIDLSHNRPALYIGTTQIVIRNEQITSVQRWLTQVSQVMEIAA